MYEAQVHEELSQLVGDSGALHKFLEAALRLESHAFESALGPVSPSLVHLTETGAGASILVSNLLQKTLYVWQKEAKGRVKWRFLYWQDTKVE